MVIQFRSSLVGFFFFFAHRAIEYEYFLVYLFESNPYRYYYSSLEVIADL